MNKRIQELSIQACKWASENAPVSEYENAADKKFAELIAQDIASLIESQDVDPAFKHRISWAVKDRYGVK